jgi:hypothetical protein
MGCSGSRVDETGRPVVVHKPNPEREQRLNYYRETMEKMRIIIKENPDIPAMNPLDKEEIEIYFNDNKEKLEQYKLTLDDFIYSLTCYKIIEDKDFYTIYNDFDVPNLISDSLRYMYKGEDSQEKSEQILTGLKLLGIKKMDALVLQGEVDIPNNILKHFLDALKYDELFDKQTMAFNLTDKMFSDSDIINSIAELVEYSKNLALVAFVCSPIALDEYPKKKGGQYNIDSLAPILQALETNIRIKAFTMVMFQEVKYVINEEHQKTLINIFKKNYCLSLCVLPNISLTESNFKKLMACVSVHKMLRGLIIDNESYNENHFNCFIGAVKKNVGIKMAGYWGFDDMDQAMRKLKLYKDIKDKIILLNRKKDDKYA